MFRATSEMSRREIVRSLVVMARAEHHALLWVRGEHDSGAIWQALQAMRLRRDVLLDAARRVSGRRRRRRLVQADWVTAAQAAGSAAGCQGAALLAGRREARALSRPAVPSESGASTRPGNGGTVARAARAPHPFNNQFPPTGKSTVPDPFGGDRASNVLSEPVTVGLPGQKNAARLTLAGTCDQHMKGGETAC